MSNFDYKKYSLEQLENWMHDAISSAEASPQEIYDVIKGVVEEQYHYFKNNTHHCSELLALLNGNGKGHIQAYDDYLSKDKVVKWVLPVQLDGLSGDLYVTLPDDLLKQVGWKEGDTVEYVPSENGFYVMRKV